MEEKRSSSPVKSETDVPPAHFLAGTSVSTHTSDTQSLALKFWRGKWLILIFIISFCLIALMFGAMQAPLYQTQTSIEIQSPAPASRTAESDDSQLIPTQESYIETQVRIIQSRSLSERVLARLGDTERTRLLESPRFWWNHASYEQEVDSIRRRLKAVASADAGIVDISFLSPDPGAGAHFLNTLTQELADLNVERAWHAAQRNRQWTDRQIDELRRKWEQSEQLLAEYSQVSGLAASNLVSDPIAPAKATADRPPLMAISAQANDARLRQLRAHLADLHKQIAQWQALYGPSSPTVLKLRSEAASTEAAIQQRHPVAQKLSAAPSAPFNPPRTSPAPPAAPPQTASTRSQSLAHFNVLKLEADSNRQIYQITSTRLREADIANASRIGDISVVDPAVPANRSATAGQLLNGALGSFVGLLLGLAFVALRDRFSPTFTEPSMLGQYLGEAVLGAIPTDPIARVADHFGDSGDPELHLSFDADPQIAEAYRSIRSSILVKAEQRSGPRRLVFTSAGVSEGKTSVVGNLGAALASAQRRVLLIDGDLRNPALHKIFGADNDHGLADLLARQISESPVASRDVIRETQIPDLYLLSAGQAGLQAPEILSSAHLPQLIREFGKAFDMVLIDSPPVLPFSDARCLARAADSVVLIVKAGSTERRAALLARNTITQDGTPMLGIILTGWDITHAQTV